LWDGQTNEIWIGTSSATVVARVQKLFSETFGHSLTLFDAGVRALQAAAGQHAYPLDDLRPTGFVPGGAATEVAWVKDLANPSYWATSSCCGCGPSWRPKAVPWRCRTALRARSC
jgi:hypothetical protein